MKNNQSSTPIDNQKRTIGEIKQTSKSRFQQSAANILSFQEDMFGEIENNVGLGSVQEKFSKYEKKKKNGFILDEQAQIEREVIFKKWGEQTTSDIPKQKLVNLENQTPDIIIRERKYNISIQELLSKKPDELLNIEQYLDEGILLPRRNLKQLERLFKSDTSLRDTSNQQSSVQIQKDGQQDDQEQKGNYNFPQNIQKVSIFSNESVNNQMRVLLQDSINTMYESQQGSTSLQRESTPIQKQKNKEEKKSQYIPSYNKFRLNSESNQVQSNDQIEEQITPLVMKYNKCNNDFTSNKMKQNYHQRSTQNGFLQKAYFLPSLQHIRLQEQLNVEKALTNVTQSNTPLRSCFKEHQKKKKNKNVRFSEQAQVLLVDGDVEQRKVVEKSTVKRKKKITFDRDGFLRFWEQST